MEKMSKLRHDLDVAKIQKINEVVEEETEQLVKTVQAMKTRAVTMQ